MAIYSYSEELGSNEKASEETLEAFNNFSGYLNGSFSAYQQKYVLCYLPLTINTQKQYKMTEF